MDIIGNVKTYEWGKIGYKSKVAELAALNASSFQVNPNETYSELWMGDHVSGPSYVKENNRKLSDVLNENKELIGGLDKLPFLFKILSIRKALSIQVHPNKEEAKKLFTSQPHLYKDDNHKPELAIALTPFVALCGFRPRAQIYQLLKAHEPLVDLIGAENVESLETDEQNGLKRCFSTVMLSTEENINICISKLYEIFKSSGPKDQLANIFQTLNTDFPNDIGILCLFFLNVLQLNPGQAIFLPANIPHAYLSGDCIECMACSDNVIRAGLTPKFKDVQTLLRLISYDSSSPENRIFNPRSLDKYSLLFAPPVEDFAVVKIDIPFNETEYTVANGKTGSILMVIAGSANGTVQNGESNIILRKGSIIFLSAKHSHLTIKLQDSKENVVVYQALNNDFFNN